MKEKVLVTGGAGFIGSHTVDAILKKGYRVAILDNLSPPVHERGKIPDYVPKEAEFILGDVRNKEDWKKALKGVDFVFHLAAYADYLPDFSKFFTVNTVGTALLYEVILEEKFPIKKIVFASSQAVYSEGKYLCLKHGAQYPPQRSEKELKEGNWVIRCPLGSEKMEPQWTDEERANPHNQYAISKYAAELIALNLGQRYGIPTVALRYSITQGPRQSFRNLYSGALRIFSFALLKNQSPPVFEDGNQLRDYINVRDVVKANLLAMRDKRANDQAFNVGGGKRYTVLQLAEKLARILGKDIKPKITRQFRVGDTRHIFSDISKLKKLGWKPTVSLEDSLKEYWEWLVIKKIEDNYLEKSFRTMQELGVLERGR